MFEEGNAAEKNNETFGRGREDRGEEKEDEGGDSERGEGEVRKR